MEKNKKEKEFAINAKEETNSGEELLKMEELFINLSEIF